MTPAELDAEIEKAAISTYFAAIREGNEPDIDAQVRIVCARIAYIAGAKAFYARGVRDGMMRAIEEYVALNDESLTKCSHDFGAHLLALLKESDET